MLAVPTHRTPSILRFVENFRGRRATACALRPRRRSSSGWGRAAVPADLTCPAGSQPALICLRMRADNVSKVLQGRGHSRETT
jgi:hypothetical protein